MKLKIKVVNPNAVIPSKAGPEEVGYDLTAIEFVKKLNAFTFMYDTGIILITNKINTYFFKKSYFFFVSRSQI